MARNAFSRRCPDDDRHQEAVTGRAPQGDALIAGFRRLAQLLERNVSEADIRASVPIGAEGMGLRTLLRAADRLGFDAVVTRATPARLNETPTPFLVTGRDPGTGSLVRSRSGERLVVVDPSSGETTSSPPADLLGPGAKIVKLAVRKDAAKRSVWRETVRRRIGPVLWEIATASVVINLLALATPIFLMTVYNKVINHQAMQTLDVMVIGMISLFAFEGLLRILRSYITSHTGARIDAAVGSEVLHHLLHLPLRRLQSLSSGELVERVRQLDHVRLFFTSQMPLLWVDLGFVVLFLAALSAIAPPLALVTAASIPLFLGLSWFAHHRQKRLVTESFEASADKASAIAEAMNAAVTVKALGLESDMEGRFDGRLAKSAWTTFRANHFSGSITASGQILQQATALVIVYVGATQIIAGNLSIGALVASTILAARALAPLRQLVGAWHQLQSVRDAFRRLDDLMAEDAERRGGKTGVEPTFRGHIRFENVAFSYREGGDAALSNIELEIRPGTIIGIVGPPGSGKTTLGKLLVGLEHPSQGRILVDDCDLRHVSSAGYRHQIGYVPQDIQLFRGTIAQNIAMGTPDCTPDRIVAAAKFVGLHDVAQRLGDGYETLLGERGEGLSSGQRQLIAVARALVRNPRILVLDEATSSVDAATEQDLLANLRRASGGRTVVMITHRLSALTFADEVAFLENGRIVRRGPASDILSYLRNGRGPNPPRNTGTA
ncbi:MAG: peptidase domain-containing ABC transporter [Geminicoccaceae bacterium]